MAVVIMMMHADLITLGDHGSRHSQSWRMIVFTFLLDVFGKGHDDHSKDKNKHHDPNDWKYGKDKIHDSSSRQM